MSTRIYDDGTAEFILVRAIFPYLAAMAMGVAIWHFGGFESRETEIDRILATVTTRLAWVSIFVVPILALVTRAVNPPRMVLPRWWVAAKFTSAAFSLVVVAWIVSMALAA